MATEVVRGHLNFQNVEATPTDTFASSGPVVPFDVLAGRTIRLPITNQPYVVEDLLTSLPGQYLYRIYSTSPVTVVVTITTLAAETVRIRSNSQRSFLQHANIISTGTATHHHEHYGKHRDLSISYPVVNPQTGLFFWFYTLTARKSRVGAHRDGHAQQPWRSRHHPGGYQEVSGVEQRAGPCGSVGWGSYGSDPRRFLPRPEPAVQLHQDRHEHLVGAESSRHRPHSHHGDALMSVQHNDPGIDLTRERIPNNWTSPERSNCR